MRVLALDISTKAGWALLEGEKEIPACDCSMGVVIHRHTFGLPKLFARGVLIKNKTALEYGPYPEGYVLAAEAMGSKLKDLIETYRPDVVVIEETNQTKSRYVQKMLEWIHLEVLYYWCLRQDEVWQRPCHDWPKYISTSVWKECLGLKKPADAKANDKLLKKAKELARLGAVTLNEAKKQLGIRGKWNKKMLAVNWVNENYGLKLKLVNNDEAEAICLGVAFLRGALLCDGDPNKDRGD